jgi:hypothetical protein
MGLVGWEGPVWKVSTQKFSQAALVKLKCIAMHIRICIHMCYVMLYMACCWLCQFAYRPKLCIFDEIFIACAVGQGQALLDQKYKVEN